MRYRFLRLTCGRIHGATVACRSDLAAVLPKRRTFPQELAVDLIDRFYGDELGAVQQAEYGPASVFIRIP